LLSLLLLLLRPLYHPPHQISRFSQRRDHVALLRVVEFHPALHLPDTAKRACQRLYGAFLLLLLLLAASLLLLATSLLLLAASLLLSTFRHTISYLTRAVCRWPEACVLRCTVSFPIPNTREN
jgi:hypothetical protein